MEFVELGRTGLRVSVAGLGCGGRSRLGLGSGKSRAEAVDLVRHTIDLGVNMIDTAHSYGTEDIVGEAIQTSRRDNLVISTKHLLWGKEGLHSADHIVAGLENSLRQLKTDYVDVFFLHALTLLHGDEAVYSHVTNEIIPRLRHEQQKGKFRFLGATAAPSLEHEQGGIVRGVTDNAFDVVMFAFSMLNQRARETIFPKAIENDVGTMLMFVVRHIFANSGHLRSTIESLVREGRLSYDLVETSDPLSFLIHPDGAKNLVDAAYRYARHEPGANVVLFGSGDLNHVRDNINSINAPPLPEFDRSRLRSLFGQLAGVGLDVPGLVRP